MIGMSCGDAGHRRELRRSRTPKALAAAKRPFAFNLDASGWLIRGATVSEAASSEERSPHGDRHPGPVAYTIWIATAAGLFGP